MNEKKDDKGKPGKAIGGYQPEKAINPSPPPKGGSGESKSKE